MAVRLPKEIGQRAVEVAEEIRRYFLQFNIKFSLWDIHLPVDCRIGLLSSRKGQELSSKAAGG